MIRYLSTAFLCGMVAFAISFAIARGLTRRERESLLLCDGCDREKRWTSSVDGRTLVCRRCRVKGWWLGTWR